MNLLRTDVVLAVWLALHDGAPATFVQLATSLHLSPSQVHQAEVRALAAKLLVPLDAVLRGQRLGPQRKNLLEFLVHGVKYAFPAERTGLTRGVPSLGGASIFHEAFGAAASGSVWPHPRGMTRGEGLVPLHRCIPEIVLDGKDARFHDVFALVDALRAGTARERAFAEERLPRLLESQGAT